MSTIKASKINVAIVEDDTLLRQELGYHLRRIGFNVHELNNGQGLDDILSTEPIDVIILDLNLPGEDGIKISKRIRANIPSIRLIMLTARSSLADRIAGYESGADIYLSKPIAAEELVATLNSLCQRLRISNLKIDAVIYLTNRSVKNNANSVTALLTHHEKVILLALVQAKNQTLKNEDIVEILARNNDTALMSKRALESMISRLRKKLDRVFDNSEPKIKSVWGVGYQLCLSIQLEP